MCLHVGGGASLALSRGMPGGVEGWLADAVLLAVGAYFIYRQQSGLPSLCEAVETWWRPPLPPHRRHFLFFGDSIVGEAWLGWMGSLANTYKRTADITNRGFNGYNSRWAMHVLPHLLPPGTRTPDVVGICLGANDAVRPAPLRGRDARSSRHHVPLDEYERNLRNIIVAAQAAGARVLVMTPPPTDGEAWLAFERITKASRESWTSDSESTRSNALTGEYAARAVLVANETAAAVVDLWSEMQALRPKGWSGLLADGVHPNAEGAELIFELVRDAIATSWPELKPAGAEGGMRFDFPGHASIDENEWATSFREWAEVRRRVQGGVHSKV